MIEAALATIRNAEPTHVAPKPTSREEAQKVASQFEAIFVQQIVSKMREGSDLLGENAMFGSGPGADIYADWFDSHMSEHLAASGRVGVADALMGHFDRLGQIEPAQTENGEVSDAQDEPKVRRSVDRVV